MLRKITSRFIEKALQGLPLGEYTIHVGANKKGRYKRYYVPNTLAPKRRLQITIYEDGTGTCYYENAEASPRYQFLELKSRAQLIKFLDSLEPFTKEDTNGR